MNFNIPPLDPSLNLTSEFQRLSLAHTDASLTTLSSGDIHQTRRLLKRLRAILTFASPHREAAAISRLIRDAGRHLSASRDIEVSHELLPLITSHLPSQERTVLHSLLPPSLHRETAISSALPLLRHAREKLLGWHQHIDWKGITAALTLSYKEALEHWEKSMAALKRHGSLSGSRAEPLHDLRKALKRLGHQLQFLPIGGEREWLHEKKRDAHHLSRLLGQEHDLHVVEENLGQHAHSLQPELSARRAILQHEATQQAAHFLRKKPHAFDRKLKIHFSPLQASGC